MPRRYLEWSAGKCTDERKVAKVADGLRRLYRAAGFLEDAAPFCLREDPAVADEVMDEDVRRGVEPQRLGDFRARGLGEARLLEGDDPPPRKLLSDAAEGACHPRRAAFARRELVEVDGEDDAGTVAGV